MELRVFDLGALLLAALVAAIAATIAYLYIRTRSQRQAEAKAGIASMASLRWRDFAHLTLEALRRQGFVEINVERQPGDSDFDFVLEREDERWLLSCKHGTSYRLGEQTVREFATAIRMHEGRGGIIATLGESDGFADEIARAHQIRLLDSRALWPIVSDLIDPQVRMEIRTLAAQHSQRLIGLAAFGTLAIFALVYVMASGENSTAYADIRKPTASPVVSTQQNKSQGLLVGKEAPMALPANLSAEQIEEHRAAVTMRIAGLASVNSAAWSTRSTLVMALNTPGEPVTAQAVESACRILVEYEELRFSRLQIEPPPGSETPVRWRQCR